MDKNILVIGNGFDIYHGLQTKYYEFVQYTKQVFESEREAEKRIFDLCKNNMFIKYFQEAAKANQGWIDCEKEIERICDIFNKLVNIDNAIDSEGSLNGEIINYNELQVLALASEYIENFSNSLFVKKKYLHKFTKINKNFMLNNLRKDLNDLIEVFYYYLQVEIFSNLIEVRSKQLEDINFTYVINFNYTNTYKLYGIDYKDVYFIHGSVENGKDSIVLGTRDGENENLDFIYFRKYFQRIQKRVGLLDKKRIEPDCKNDYGILKYDSVNTYFFGHSLSSTDGDMIKEIVKSSNKVIIFYYDSADYEQKVINLIDIFGKEEALELIYGDKSEFVELDDAEKITELSIL